MNLSYSFKSLFLRLMFAVLVSLALLPLRFHLLSVLHLSFSSANRIGFGIGIFRDLVLGLAISAISLLIAAVIAPVIAMIHPKISWGMVQVIDRMIWIFLIAIAWVLAASHTVYFELFGNGLTLKTVIQHWSEIGDITGWVPALINSPAIQISAGLFCLVLALRWMSGLIECEVSILRKPAHAFLLGVFLLIFAQFFHQIPIWSRIEMYRHSVVGRQIVLDTLIDWKSEQAELKTVDKALVYFKRPEALLRYRNWGQEKSPLEASIESAFPLVKEFKPEPQEVRRSRLQLGLPPEGAVNVVLLLVESFRIFEFKNEVIAPHVFPRLRRFLAQHGLLFTQAYSSGVNTDNGDFATSCSQLSELEGSTTYHAHPTVRLKCLNSYFRDQHYLTAWSTGLPRSFGGMDVFELVHGTDQIFDEQYFAQLGARAKVNQWGLDDGPVLSILNDRIVDWSREQRPFFLKAMTISTHMPLSVVSEGPLPPHLLAANTKSSNYPGYLSRFRYADSVVTDFLEKLFDGPAGNNTLVVLLGDQVVLGNVMPHLTLTQIQEREINARIPIAFLTKKMPKPGEIAYPVHQVDIAPTVANIVGFSSQVTWLGRNMLKGMGSPWVYKTSHGIHYRTEDRGCYSFAPAMRPRCFSLTGNVDPLFSNSLKEIPEDRSLTHYFEELAIENSEFIQANRIAPVDFK